MYPSIPLTSGTRFGTRSFLFHHTSAQAPGSPHAFASANAKRTRSIRDHSSHHQPTPPLDLARTVHRAWDLHRRLRTRRRLFPGHLRSRTGFVDRSHFLQRRGKPLPGLQGERRRNIQVRITLKSQVLPVLWRHARYRFGKSRSRSRPALNNAGDPGTAHAPAGHCLEIYIATT